MKRDKQKGNKQHQELPHKPEIMPENPHSQSKTTLTPTMTDTDVPNSNTFSRAEILEHLQNTVMNAFKHPSTFSNFELALKPMLERHTKELIRQNTSLWVEVNRQKQIITSLESKISKLEAANEALTPNHNQETALLNQQNSITLLENRICKLEATNQESNYNRNQEEISQNMPKEATNTSSVNRKQNLIFHGITENEALTEEHKQPSKTDEEKVKHVLHQIGHGEKKFKNLTRLGMNNTLRNRPIRITLNNTMDVAKILQDKRKLRSKAEIFSHIYIKRDTHPAIRAEDRRLREVVKKEKSRPENKDKEICYDQFEQCVRINGKIIDYFHARPLQILEHSTIYKEINSIQNKHTEEETE